jgi:hypothetical protein
MTRSNCLLYAVRQWWTLGGCLVVRKSQYGWWPHFLWSQDLVQFFAFVPVQKARRRCLPPLWFAGRAVRVKVNGDTGEC